MSLSDADAARLARLKASKDALISGKSTRKVQSGGRLLENFDADLRRLQGEIDALETESATGRPAARRGAIRFSVG